MSYYVIPYKVNSLFREQIISIGITGLTISISPKETDLHRNGRMARETHVSFNLEICFIMLGCSDIGCVQYSQVCIHGSRNRSTEIEVIPFIITSNYPLVTF